MTTRAFDRWFLEADHQGLWCIWLARHDEDPSPAEFACLHPDGRVLVNAAWPLLPDQLGEAMAALHARHLDRMSPQLRAAREAT